jgi:hypothetical protein
MKVLRKDNAMYSIVFGIFWITEKYSVCYNIKNGFWKKKMLKLQYVVSKPAQLRAADADIEALTTPPIT